MNKVKFILFSLFFCVKVLSQNIEANCVKDTIYIFFNKSLKYDDLNLKVIRNKNNTDYQYIYPDGNHLDFLTYSNGNLTKNNFCRNKSFLKKIIKSTLTIEDFKKYGYYKSITFFSKKISIFIIDNDDFRKNTVTIKQAYFKNNIEIKI